MTYQVNEGVLLHPFSDQQGIALFHLALGESVALQLSELAFQQLLLGEYSTSGENAQVIRQLLNRKFICVSKG